MNVIRAHDYKAAYGPDFSAMQPNLRALRRILYGLIAIGVFCCGMVVFLVAHPAQRPVVRSSVACTCKGQCMRGEKAR